MEENLLEELTKIDLPNKLRIWHKELPDQEFVSLRLLIGVGSAHQSMKELGLAHLVEHLVFNRLGEGNEVKRKLFDEIEQSGGYINAQTSVESTIVIADIPRNKLDSALEYIKLCLLQPDFSNRSIKTEKRVIINELNQDLGFHSFFYFVYRNLWGKHPLSYSGIGTPFTLRRLKRQSIESFYRKHYVANKMTLVCIGKITQEEIKNLILDRWNQLPQNNELKERFETPKSKKGLLNIIDARSRYLIMYGYMISGSKGPNKDYYSLWFLMDYLRKILFDFLREKGMLYDIMVVYSELREIGLFYVFVPQIEKHHKEVLNKIREEIKKIREIAIDADNFRKNMDFTTNQLLNCVKDIKELANYYGSWVEHAGDVDEYANPLTILRALTPEDIRDVARKYFVREREFLVGYIMTFKQWCLGILLGLGLLIGVPLIIAFIIMIVEKLK